MDKMIAFNIPSIVGKELEYIQEALKNLRLSGNGDFTKRCHDFFNSYYKFQNCLLTSSCTDALEMSAILARIQPGDEIIMPSFTFVSTANAFLLRGAKLIFVDSRSDHPGMNEELIEELITDKTKVIVPVHYAGVACDMDKIINLAKKYNLLVVEDAAQAIDSFYKGIPLGSIGDMSAFSFHETKNVISGEGGMLVVNNPDFSDRSEIIWEKGTNRSAFWRGEVDKYGWVDVGSSFLPSELTAAFLYAQLEELQTIQRKRKGIWHEYFKSFQSLQGSLMLPALPDYATNNAHMFYLVCSSLNERNELIRHLHQAGVQAVFHYQSLHKSSFYTEFHDGRELPYADYYSNCLVRLPLHLGLTSQEVDRIIEGVISFTL